MPKYYSEECFCCSGWWQRVRRRVVVRKFLNISYYYYYCCINMFYGKFEIFWIVFGLRGGCFAVSVWFVLGSGQWEGFGC